jgi:hypothetical protein
MKREFVIPEKISLAGSIITVRYGKELSDDDFAGLWCPNTNEILLNPLQSPAVQFETFIHELSEAINQKFVNEPEGKRETDHRIIDAYARGFFNFLIENAHLIIKETKK